MHAPGIASAAQPAPTEVPEIGGAAQPAPTEYPDVPEIAECIPAESLNAPKHSTPMYAQIVKNVAAIELTDVEDALRTDLD